MEPTTVAALSAAGQSAFSGIMSNSANAKSKRATNRAAMMNFLMANYFMDKQNEYNKPVNQMARLREAGLNPNLVYGDGGATMASASGSSSVGASDVTPASGSFNVLGKMQILKSMKQQDANIAETEARTQAIDDNTELKKLQLAETVRFNDARLKMLQAQISRYGVQDEKTLAEIEYLKNKFDIKNPNDWRKLADRLEQDAKNSNAEIPLLW